MKNVTYSTITDVRRFNLSDEERKLRDINVKKRKAIENDHRCATRIQYIIYMYDFGNNTMTNKVTNYLHYSKSFISKVLNILRKE